jgi:hypothetical protein
MNIEETKTHLSLIKISRLVNTEEIKAYLSLIKFGHLVN